MDFITVWDLALLEIWLAGFLLMLIRSGWKRLLQQEKSPPKFPLLATQRNEVKLAITPTRSIKKMLQQTGKTCIVFYGSQTGTAEKYAVRIARDAGARYNLPCLVADLDDYDFDDLNTLGDGYLAIFLLATYGEGEPTDNAIAFNKWLTLRERRGSVSVLDDKRIQLQYAAFGLGNSSYQFYNSMIRRVDGILSGSGATRICDVGFGDDGKKTMEEDFGSWKLVALDAVARRHGLQEVEYSFKADYKISEIDSPVLADVFQGEPNKLHLRQRIEGPFTSSNPLRANIVEAKELFTSGDRNCIHLEFDTTGTTLSYETGDHLAVWPVNANAEVDRFLKVFGLSEKRASVISAQSHDSSVKVPIPALTTYEAAVRYYLDIGAPVSRQLLNTLENVISDSDTRTKLLNLSDDAVAFGLDVAAPRLTLAQTLLKISAGAFQNVPFSFLLENVARLQPRFYSISSSATVAQKRISITAVVESRLFPGTDHTFKGVSTNYLLALKSDFEGTPSGTHKTSGPRDIFTCSTALIHVRKSKFRLPRAASTPIIMIGPGTGVAPFRAFVQERAFEASMGKKVGRSMLFYGCRRSDEDFLYKEEWEKHRSTFPPGIFTLHTAFSRENGGKKVYVQDVIQDCADELRDLILHKGAHVYICGDASRMAKDVFLTLSEIVGHDCQNLFNQTGQEYLRGLKSCGRWNEDVW